MRNSTRCEALVNVSEAKVGASNLVCQMSDGSGRNDGTFEEKRRDVAEPQAWLVREHSYAHEFERSVCKDDYE